MASREAAMKELLAGLNEDFAAEFTAVIMYAVYAAQVDGIHRAELKQFFQSEIADEQLHAQLLADKIVALGGEIRTNPNPVPDARTNKARLQAAHQAEVDTIGRYIKRIEQAESVGEIALKVELETLLTDETKHRDEMQLMLKNYKGD